MSNQRQSVRFFTFSQFHNKRPPAGSTHIRVNQLIKYWPEAGLYQYGENPETLIFQKVYVGQDYDFPVHFEGIKILDICDPDWMSSMTPIKQTLDAMDAITCPTQPLVDFLKQMTDKPVVLIKDRFDISELPKPKEHKDKAKSVVWFGYRHNIDTLKPALPIIDKLGLNLIVIADDDPMAWTWVNDGFKNRYKFIKHEANIYADLLQADFAVLPKGVRPVDIFKSENKTVKAILAGLPVATTKEEVELFMSADARNEHLSKAYDITRAEYDVKNSVAEYKELIKQLKQSKSKQ